jgi:diadenylate cyclase
VLAELGRLTPEELLDMASMGKALDLTGDQEALDTVVAPRGYRLLARVPQLPPEVVERVVERFGSLKVILAVGVEDLEEAEGVGAGGARQLREGLKRLAEGGKPEGDG